MAIHADLRSMYSVDLNVDNEIPPDPECFTVRIDAEIGPRGNPGADRFSFDVCTPQWLASEVGDSGFLWCRHTLIIRRWEVGQIRDALRSMCERVTGNTWEEVARKLSESAKWEFLDYHPRSDKKRPR